MKNIKKLFSVLFSAILLFSATTTSSVAHEKLHFVIGGGAGGVLFVRSRKDSTSKDFASVGGLLNQLQPVDTSAYQPQTQQSNQPQAQQQSYQPVQTVEVVQQPVAVEPTILRQWTDASGYTWRAMDDGNTYWWTGAEWQKYG